LAPLLDVCLLEVRHAADRKEGKQEKQKHKSPYYKQEQQKHKSPYSSLSVAFFTFKPQFGGWTSSVPYDATRMEPIPIGDDVAGLDAPWDDGPARDC